MVHLKYPSMERQDLTQGQLGSFKFTPVDEIQNRFVRTSHPFCPPHLSSSFQDVKFLDQRAHIDHSPALSNVSFFNSYIKPDLNDSRLRFGPAALRTAVESASSSPQRSFAQLSIERAMRPTAATFSPNGWPATLSTSAMSDFASEQVAGPAPSANASLLLALENEQQAHETTKLSLENETARRMKFESEFQQLSDYNKSLLSSIHLLQSTVKHMVQRENSDQSTDDKALEAAVQDFNERVKTAKVKDSILYNPLTKKETSCLSSHPTYKKSEENGSKFNLELVEAPASDDESNKAQLQRTLRRQLEISPSEPKSSIEFDRSAKTNQPPEHEEPETPERENEPTIVRAYEPYIYNKLGDEASVPRFLHEVTDELNSTDGDVLVKEMEKLNLSSTPILHLPEEFLKKYGKPSVKAEHIENMAALQPSKTNVPKTPIKPRTRLPFSPEVRWNITEDNPLFKTNEDLKAAVRGQQRRDSYFSQYPVRYVPDLAKGNIFRTVMIDYIPPEATYKDVLAHVRGGCLESIKIFPPIGHATDYSTARIVYKHESGAITLYKRGQSPGVTIRGRRTRVWQVLEPTYPSHKELEDAIYEEGYTRLLVVNPPDQSLMQNLPAKLKHQMSAGVILGISKATDGMPMVEFTSIEEAFKALRVLMEDPEFGGTVFDFEEDYCETAYI